MVVDLQQCVLDEHFLEEYSDGYFNELLGRMQEENASILSFMAYHVQRAQTPLYESADITLDNERQDKALHITEFGKMRLYLEGAKLYDLIDQSHRSKGYATPYASPIVCTTLNGTVQEMELSEHLDYSLDTLNVLRKPFPYLVDFIYTTTELATDYFDEMITGLDRCSQTTYTVPSTEVDKMFSAHMLIGLTGVASCMYFNEHGVVQRQLLE